MAYTEVKEKNKKKYYYRVKSIREGEKVKKKRIYLGKNLSKKELKHKEREADVNLNAEKKFKNNEVILKIRNTLKKYKIKKAGIFGSYSVGKQKRDSDIDILIEPPKNMGFGFAGIEIELEEKLGKKVDLVSYNGISPYLKKRILKQQIRII